MSEASSPRTISRRASLHIEPVEPQPQQGYWNEYDDGSEAEHEVYTIYVDPNSASKYPGSKLASYLFNQARVPVEKVKEWLSPISPASERQPLLRNGDGSNESLIDQPETDVDDDADAYASSSDFPAGYATHYATFPSVNDQKLLQERKKLLLQGIIGAFAASVLLMVIAGILVATGRNKQRVEVDAGVFTGVAASLLFATMAFAGMLYEHERIATVYRWIVTLTFVVICVLNSFIMAVTMSDTRL